MTAEEVLAELRSHANPRAREGQARFGITTARSLGINLPTLRAIAKMSGRDHALAEQLWQSGIHEARILAAMVDDPAKVTRRQMDRWAKEFDSWDVVDGAAICFDKTPYAYEKAHAWRRSKREYVKRAASS